MQGEIRQALPLVYLVSGTCLCRSVVTGEGKGPHGHRHCDCHVHRLVRLGRRYFGWGDPDGKVQLAFATCFILGFVSGYKVKLTLNNR